MSVLAGGPLAQNGDGRLEVFARGDDNAVWHIWQLAANNGWGNWVSLGGTVSTWSSYVQVANNADGRLEVFVHFHNDPLQHMQTAARNGWWTG